MKLFTFDIFGTVIDWRRGMREAVAACGHALTDGEFERVIDLQGELEQAAPGRRYRDVTAESLVRVVGLDERAARAIGEGVGRWPLFDDAREGIRRLRALAPCVATTNSDLAHGRDVMAQLGAPSAREARGGGRLRRARLDGGGRAEPPPIEGWLCAEALGSYKPSPAFFSAVAAARRVEPGRDWYHVSAYADYDLGPAAALGLTTVFIERPHARPGPSTLVARDLLDLAARLAP